MRDEDAVRLMQCHADAWNAHDIDALLRLMTEDCVYNAAVGPEAFGKRHVGHAALAQAFPAIWAAIPDARWDEATHMAMGGEGITFWTFRGTGQDDHAIETLGLDRLRFRDGLICLKDTYRKAVTR